MRASREEKSFLIHAGASESEGKFASCNGRKAETNIKVIDIEKVIKAAFEAQLSPENKARSRPDFKAPRFGPSPAIEH